MNKFYIYLQRADGMPIRLDAHISLPEPEEKKLHSIGTGSLVFFTMSLSYTAPDGQLKENVILSFGDNLQSIDHDIVSTNPPT